MQGAGPALETQQRGDSVCPQTVKVWLIKSKGPYFVAETTVPQTKMSYSYYLTLDGIICFYFLYESKSFKLQSLLF